MTRLRVVRSAPGRAAWNMALDEALARSPLGGPTLRLYGWAPPALSLGFFQAVDGLDLDAAARAGLDLVRRPTGGGAIIHEAELTYALCLPGERSPGACVLLAEAVAAALRAAGIDARLREGEGPPGCPAACFAGTAATDIVCCPGSSAPLKLSGMAQRVWREGTLVHGSLPFAYRADLHEAVFGEAPRGFAWLALLAPEVTKESVCGNLIEEIARCLGAQPYEGEPEAAEILEAGRLCVRYGSREWTLGGRRRVEVSSVAAV